MFINKTKTQINRLEKLVELYSLLLKRHYNSCNSKPKDTSEAEEIFKPYRKIEGSGEESKKVNKSEEEK